MSAPSAAARRPVVAGQRNVLITSALPYVNNVPHLGTLIGCVLSADVFARYCRLRGYNTLYVCGTDEYGTATEVKALQMGITPREVCDKFHVIHRDSYAFFGVEFDAWGRTSTEDQTEVAQDIFKRLDERGHILTDTMEQLYCPTCERFLADRYVEGTCPLCKYSPARGDQCDGCGKLLNTVELIDPTCIRCRSTPAPRSSQHLFLDLPRLSQELTAWVDASNHNWTPNACQVTAAWLRDGLRPRCITRDLKWGTPVPKPDFEEKVFYVWFDAPIGYISITKTAFPDDWHQWWHSPENVELYQFIGKDNIPFHCVMFPACLLGAQDHYSLLKTISVTDYLNYEGGKFSKSNNTGVFCDQASSTGIASDVWRYYLLANRPETSDSQFLWDDFASKNNNELLKNLGNFVNRTLTFVAKFCDGVIPAWGAVADFDQRTQEFVVEVNKCIAAYLEALEGVKLKEGLRVVMELSSLGNAYFQNSTPWRLIKSEDAAERARAATIISVLCNAVYQLSTLVEPYLPTVAAQIRQQLQVDLHAPIDGFALRLQNHTIGTPEVLFHIIEAARIAELKSQFGASLDAPTADAAGATPAAATAAAAAGAPAKAGKPGKKPGKPPGEAKAPKPAAAPKKDEHSFVAQVCGTAGAAPLAADAWDALALRLAAAGSAAAAALGADAVASLQAAAWVQFCSAAPLTGEVLPRLNDYLALRVHLVGYSLSAADLAVWAAIQQADLARDVKTSKDLVHLQRWFSYVAAARPSRTLVPSA